ncbi:MAG: hypothetical protein ACFE89_02170 [Candidatus Hodarchaeota archaeon]
MTAADKCHWHNKKCPRKPRPEKDTAGACFICRTANLVEVGLYTQGLLKQMLYYLKLMVEE